MFLKVNRNKLGAFDERMRQECVQEETKLLLPVRQEWSLQIVEVFLSWELGDAILTLERLFNWSVEGTDWTVSVLNVETDVVRSNNFNEIGCICVINNLIFNNLNFVANLVDSLLVYTRHHYYILLII